MFTKYHLHYLLLSCDDGDIAGKLVTVIEQYRNTHRIYHIVNVFGDKNNQQNNLHGLFNELTTAVNLSFFLKY